MRLSPPRLGGGRSSTRVTVISVAVVAIVSVCAGGGAIRMRPVLAAGSRTHVPTNSENVRTGRVFWARTGSATMAMTNARIGKACLPIVPSKEHGSAHLLPGGYPRPQVEECCPQTSVCAGASNGQSDANYQWLNVRRDCHGRGFASSSGFHHTSPV